MAVSSPSSFFVKIIDFGLSRVCQNAMDGSRNGATGVKAAGTVSTAAPEVIRGEEYAAASDVWSVGCLFYKLIAKKNPFLEDHADPQSDPAGLGRLNAGDCDWACPEIARTSKPGKAFLYKCFRPKVHARWSE